jgi:NTP pyrophosphatase (non-canonical NTP hydrolase)
MSDALSGPVGDTRPLLDGDNLDERLTFAELQAISVIRCLRWHGPDTEQWSGADWSNAMCGEAGEAANVVKKLRRLETGTGAQDQPTAERLHAMLGEELADVACYLVLVAAYYGIDLGAAVIDKFNAVSEREGFPERIGEHRD